MERSGLVNASYLADMDPETWLQNTNLPLGILAAVQSSLLYLKVPGVVPPDTLQHAGAVDQEVPAGTPRASGKLRRAIALQGAFVATVLKNAPKANFENRALFKS